MSFLSGHSALAFSVLVSFAVRDQAPAQTSTVQGELILLHPSTAPFPHPQRASGHVYDQTFYAPDQHYRDSTVAVFIPKDFSPGPAVNLVVHFHGWSNSLDSVLKRYQLVEQMVESGKNAILLVPQGPRNAPDSFGGKLEDANGFSRFITDVLDSLFTRSKIPTKNVGNIILSGHSGGYEVISFILMRGGLTEHIKEVYLFDALYGQTEKFAHWLGQGSGKLIDIYTENGGTKDQSEQLEADAEGWKIPSCFKLEIDATAEDLRSNKLILLYSALAHDEVVNKHSSFREFLKASLLEDRPKR